MRKIIFTLCLFASMQHVFAGDHFYLQVINHTQNTTQQGSYFGTTNVLANTGDSVSLYTVECEPCQVAHAGPWYLDGDSIPGSASIGVFHLVVTQSATYSVASFLFSPIMFKFYICVPPTAPPPTPPAIVGPSHSACPNETTWFQINNAVPCATSYTWIPPAGAVILSGNGTPHVTISFTSGFTASDTLRLVANNSFGSSAEQKLNIVYKGPPAKPGIITGQNYGVCGLNNVIYSVPQASGVYYAWTIPAGATMHPTQSNLLKVYYPNTPISGQITVTQVNGCGSSPVRVKNIFSVPATPSAISGPSTVCSGSTGNAYSIPPVLSAISYIWTCPAGSHISDGTTTSAANTLTTASTSVTVSYGTVSAGTWLRVKAANNCGSSVMKRLALTPCSPRTILFAEESESPDNIDFFDIYPTVVNSSITIELSSVKSNNIEISIFDINGKQLKTDFYKNSSGEFIKNENTEALAKGIYFIKIKAGEEVMQKKFVKM